jgi:HEAT repeat protein
VVDFRRDMSVLKPNIVKLRKKRKTQALIKVLSYKNRNVRDAAVEALGEVGDSQAVNPLIYLLEDRDEDAALRERACKALGMIGDPRAIETLDLTLKDEDPGVRRASAEALKKLGWMPGRNETGLNYWLSWLITYDYDNDCRYVNDEAVDALVQIGDLAVEPLIELLYGNDRLLISAAIEVLSRTRDPRAIEPLVSVLEEENNWIRKKAVESLGDIASVEGLEPLISVIEQCNRSKGVCIAAIDALGKIGDPRAMKPLFSLLHDEDVREAAERALELLRE